jgi:hypothetical protein
MYNISKALMKPTAIPPIRQKKLDKRLFIITAGSAILLGLNAMAADASPADTPAAPGARNQQDIRQEMREHWEKMSPEEREQVRNKMKEHWNNMSPEEREARRKEMREHFKNMSPEERQQFKRDLGKQDGVPAPHEGNSGDSTGDAGRPAKPVGSIDK